MGHPAIENKTPFAFHAGFSSDEESRLLLAPTIKGTFSIGEDGRLRIEEKQAPVNLAGEFWDEPGKSSYKYEPEIVFTKLATDVALIGHACARETTSIDVRLRVGSIDKTVRVTGDRYWLKSLGMISMSSPEKFESIPLLYERAFGGWDRSHPDPLKHSFESRNPVGVGFRSKQGQFEEGIRVPNLEDPRDPVREYGQTVTPAGFGFTSSDWQPRAGLAGTYDEQWTRERMPLLPKDFDRRFFNAASQGLIAPGYLKGDEAVSIENVSLRGTILFNLPGIPPPECRIQLTGSRAVRMRTSLDTVIINADEHLVFLLWRSYLPVKYGPHDVVSIEIQADGASAVEAAR